MKLAQSFYLTEDVVVLAKELLGKVLVTQMDGVKTSGIIVETEAYLGVEDKAAHVYKNRRTKRTEVFYREGGIAYVYMCYGIHYLFNIITNTKEVPHAILIRALEPNEGIEVMLERRKKKKLDTTLTKGPGALSMALGIDKSLNGVSLTGNTIWLEDRSCTILPETIKEVPRVGVDYAEEWATKPLRFYINGNSWVSKPNK